MTAPSATVPPAWNLGLLSLQRMGELDELVRHGTIGGIEVGCQPHFRHVAAYWSKPTFDGLVMQLECNGRLRSLLGDPTYASLNERDEEDLRVALADHLSSEGGGLFAQDSWPSLYGTVFWAWGARLLNGNRFEDAVATGPSFSERRDALTGDAVRLAAKRLQVSIKNTQSFVLDCCRWDGDALVFSETPDDPLVGPISARAGCEVATWFKVDLSTKIPGDEKLQALGEGIARFTERCFQEIGGYYASGGFVDVVHPKHEGHVSTAATHQALLLLQQRHLWGFLGAEKLSLVVNFLLATQDQSTNRFAVAHGSRFGNIVSTRMAAEALMVCRDAPELPAELRARIERAIDPDRLSTALLSMVQSNGDVGLADSAWPNLWCVRNAVSLIDIISRLRDGVVAGAEQRLMRAMLERVEVYRDGGLATCYLPAEHHSSAPQRVSSSP